MVRISDAELKIMNIVWKKGETTSLEIINELKNCSWNNNTIRTLIGRLYEKKAIGIIKKEGKTFTYAPLIEEKKYKSKVIEDLIDDLYDGSDLKFFEFLIDNDKYYEEIRKIMKMEEK